MTFTEDNQIRSKLRFLARLLVKLRDMTGLKLSLSDFIHPKYYDSFVSAVIELRKENQQLAVTLGFFIRKIALKKKATAIKNGNETERTVAADFLDVYDSSWNELVASSTLRMQQLQKVNKQVKLPDASDLQKLQKYVTSEIDKSTSYTHLQKLILSALILFNKRRPAEVADITLLDFRTASLSKDDRDDIIRTLSLEERAMAARYVRFDSSLHLHQNFPIRSNCVINDQPLLSYSP